MMKTNILLTIIIFAMILCGCEKAGEAMRDKHVIPYVQVETVIDLRMADFDCLNWTGGAKYVSVSSTGKQLGYRGNGLLVYNVNGDEYKCWDATCTRCPEASSHLELKKSEGVCPSCNTRFDLTYGLPWGESEKLYPLKSYPVVVGVKKLTISY